MLDWLTGRRRDRLKAEKLYGEVVTLARTRGFYSHYGVQDTPEGRFEMVALALFLVLERLNGLPGSNDLVRATIETFVTDMDDCMREMGVGDLVVGKRVKRAAGAFYERAASYRAALGAGTDAPLAAALRTHVFGTAPQFECRAEALAHLVHALKKQLEDAPIESILNGEALRTLGVKAACAPSAYEGKGRQ